MGNVLEKAKQEQVIALGRLGWSLRRIEAATGVRREAAGGYLRSAGIALRTPGGWGRKAPAKAATSVTTGLDSSKAGNEVTTDFLPEVTLPEQCGKRPSGASEAYREMIELELSRGRNAMDIVSWTDGTSFRGTVQGNATPRLSSRANPGIPATLHMTGPRVRLSVRKAAWSSSTP